MIAIELPWPPTANTYWRRNGSRYFISKKGIEYRNLTVYKTGSIRGLFSKEDRINVEILAYPPDRRRRDIDNLLKVILDSLQFAHVYPDDSQIDCITIKRMPEFLAKVNVKLSLMGD